MSRRATILLIAGLVTALCACEGPEVGGPLAAGGAGSPAAAGAASGGESAGGGGTASLGGGANSGGLAPSEGGTGATPSGGATPGGGAAPGGGGSSGSGGVAACVEGTESTVGCGGGLNGRAVRTMVCEEGSLRELRPCTDPDECRDDALTGGCPSSVEVCVTGEWQAAPERCDACDIVACGSGSGVDCCGGWGAFALTAGTYVHAPALLDELTVDPGAVTARFGFTQGGQLGIISLDLPVERPIDTYYDVAVGFSFEGAVTLEISFDRDEAGVAFGLTEGGTVDPSYSECFPPGSACIESYSRINLRLRSTSAGAATLTVSDIYYP